MESWGGEGGGWVESWGWAFRVPELSLWGWFAAAAGCAGWFAGCAGWFAGRTGRDRQKTEADNGHAARNVAPIAAPALRILPRGG